jgi:hypothetical protein
MTVVYLGIAFAGFSPPTLLQSGTDGVNGIAGDDATMSIVALGAAISLIPLLFTKMANGRPTWKDPLRLAVLGTWVAAFAVNVVEAFFIELNTASFGGGGSIPGAPLAANDQVFGEVQTMFGLFALTGVALILMAAEYYQVSGRLRKTVGWMSVLGIIAAVAVGQCQIEQNKVVSP